MNVQVISDSAQESGCSRDCPQVVDTKPSIRCQPPSLNLHPNGPIYLLGQNGVSTPSCLYCPNPQYSEQALKNRVEGTAVVEAIIDASGRAKQVWEVSGLSDG